MEVIVNTNRLIAALLKDSASRRIIFSGKAGLYTLEFGKKEVQKHRGYILKKARISSETFDGLMDSILDKLVVVSENEVKPQAYAKAREAMGRVDPDDVPFLALALSVENDGIWTEDKHFLRQTLAETWSTARLCKRLGL